MSLFTKHNEVHEYKCENITGQRTNLNVTERKMCVAKETNMTPKVMDSICLKIKWFIINDVFYDAIRAGFAALERREAGEDGNRPGDAEAGGPPTGPPAAGQRRSPQPAAPQQE